MHSEHFEREIQLHEIVKSHLKSVIVMYVLICLTQSPI